jgi:hypothetical protein
MSDEADVASDREELDRANAIAAVRRFIPIVPVLDCPDCLNITQTTARETCRDYAACLSDWAKRNPTYK